MIRQTYFVLSSSELTDRYVLIGFHSFVPVELFNDFLEAKRHGYPRSVSISRDIRFYVTQM